MKNSRLCTQHTPEPWRIPENDWRSGIIVGAFGTDTAVALSGEKQNANALRIVACVNACRGLTDYELDLIHEAGYPMAAAHVHQRCLEAEQQLADLLAAIDAWETNPTTGNEFAIKEAAAIAKAWASA